MSIKVGLESRIAPGGRLRRLTMLRRRLAQLLPVTARRDANQGDLLWTHTRSGAAVWEIPVLVTSVDLEVRTLAQLYRDRSDSENPLDELD